MQLFQIRCQIFSIREVTKKFSLRDQVGWGHREFGVLFGCFFFFFHHNINKITSLSRTIVTYTCPWMQECPATSGADRWSVTNCHRWQSLQPGVELWALALRQSTSETLKRLDGRARALRGRYQNKCPVWKGELLPLSFTYARWQMSVKRFFICLHAHAIRKSACISIHFTVCDPLPVSSSQYIIMMA